MKYLTQIHAEITQNFGAAQARCARLRRLAGQMAGGAAAISSLFGADKHLADTLAEIEAVDIRYGVFGPSRGLFTPDAHAAQDVARIFTDICVRQWSHDHRPSLPAIAEGLLACLGVMPDQVESGAGLSAEEAALARALMLVGLRAEYIRGQAPTRAVRGQANSFHNTLHTAYVTLIAGYLAQSADGALDLSDRLTLVLAALAHDVDHQGRGNPHDQPMANEQAAFAVIRPALVGCDVTRGRVRDILLMLRTTSPNGPHAYLKAIAGAARGGQTGAPIDPEARFTDLDVMLGDPRLVEMAAMLSDADLYASAGAGLEANKVMSLRLTRELRDNGVDMDFTSDAARLGFLDNIVGADGFCSRAGRDLFNGFFQDLKNYTQMRLKMGRGDIQPDRG